MEYLHRMKECNKEFPKIKFVKKIEEGATWY